MGREFFVPAQTLIGVKLLSNHEAQFKSWCIYAPLVVKLLNCFDGGIGTNMRKAPHPSGVMGSSNPRCWRCEQLHHHGDGVCYVICAFCVVIDL